MLRYSIIIFGFILSSCAYNNVTYFSPESKPEINIVSGSRGPKEIVQVQLNEKIKISQIIFNEPGNGFIRYYFSLPKGDTLQFIEPTITIIESNKKKKQLVEINNIQANYIVNGIGSLKKLKPIQKLIGESYLITTPYGNKELVSRNFEADIKLNHPLPNQFELHTPSVNLSGLIVNIPSVKYTKKSGTFYQARPW